MDTDNLVVNGVLPRSVSPADDALSLLEEPYEDEQAENPVLGTDHIKDNVIQTLLASSATKIVKHGESMNVSNVTGDSNNHRVNDNVSFGENSNSNVIPDCTNIDNNQVMHSFAKSNGEQIICDMNNIVITNSHSNHGELASDNHKNIDLTGNNMLTTTADVHCDASPVSRTGILTSTPVSQKQYTEYGQKINDDYSLNTSDAVVNLLGTSIIKEQKDTVKKETSINRELPFSSEHSNNSTTYQIDASGGIKTKTPRSQSGSGSQPDSPATYHSMRGSIGEDSISGSARHERSGSFSSSCTQASSTDYHNRIKTPILGYEIMEERARFTVFKVQVKLNVHDSWFIFRRYNDFVRLNDKLRELFPLFRLSLPPKRWFGDNYEHDFLDHRKKGLQAFLNNVMRHSEVSESKYVKDFLCLDDPPGGHETLEESKAQCESMEGEIYNLHQELEERDSRISLLQEELELQRLEIENLKKTLKYERTIKRRSSGQSLTDYNSLTDVEQSRLSNIGRNSKENSPFKKFHNMTPSPSSIAEDVEESSPVNVNISKKLTMSGKNASVIISTKAKTVANFSRNNSLSSSPGSEKLFVKNNELSDVTENGCLGNDSSCDSPQRAKINGQNANKLELNECDKSLSDVNCLLFTKTMVDKCDEVQPTMTQVQNNETVTKEVLVL